MNIKFRKSKKEDSEDLLALVNNYSKENSLLRKDLGQLLVHNYFVALDNDQIVGAIGYKDWARAKLKLYHL